MYDLIFITNLPAFYKVNLYNAISKKAKIFVIFLSEGTHETRSLDFVNQNFNFDSKIITYGSFQSRNKIKSSIKTFQILKSLRFKKIILGGWDFIEYWLVWFFYHPNQLAMVLESSIYESKTKGIHGWVKKIFLKKVKTVYASGNAHKELLVRLNFSGIIRITKGVGIIDKTVKGVKSLSFQKKFLYVGRLTPEKNLEMLIGIFNSLNNHELTIVGKGPLESSLKKIASNNIVFTGNVDNHQLSQYYSGNNFLILPSISEPWGLVVEEALYFGIPVLVSQNCGSSQLVINGENGFVFDPNNPFKLKELIISIDGSTYNEFQKHIKTDFIDSKDLTQVNTFLN